MVRIKHGGDLACSYTVLTYFLSFFLSRPRLGSETFCGWGLFNCSDEMNQQYSLNFHMLWRKLIVLLMNDVYPRDTGSPGHR